jgi:hypothetical protein
MHEIFQKPISEVLKNTLVNLILHYTFKIPNRIIDIELMVKRLKAICPDESIFQAWLNDLINLYLQSWEGYAARNLLGLKPKIRT